jgi:hypothetical protein
MSLLNYDKRAVIIVQGSLPAKPGIPQVMALLGSTLYEHQEKLFIRSNR